MRYSLTVKFKTVPSNAQVTRVNNKLGYQILPDVNGKYAVAKVKFTGNKGVMKFKLPKKADVGVVMKNVNNSLSKVQGYKSLTFTTL